MSDQDFREVDPEDIFDLDAADDILDEVKKETKEDNKDDGVLLYLSSSRGYGRSTCKACTWYERVQGLFAAYI